MGRFYYIIIFHLNKYFNGFNINLTQSLKNVNAEKIVTDMFAYIKTISYLCVVFKKQH